MNNVIDLQIVVNNFSILNIICESIKALFGKKWRIADKPAYSG
jgi:hypothetical protein